MRAAAYDTVVPNSPITSLPLNLVETASRASPILVLLLALPVALAGLVPFWLILQHAGPALLGSNPAATITLGIALIAWTALFGWPIARQTGRFGLCRSITITHGHVRVADRGLLASSAWNEPLSAYLGLAHHVRSSLSGTRHELLLIHPDPARSLLLRTAASISHGEIDVLTNLLGCREIAPRMFYRKPQQHLPPFAVAQPGLATAQ